MATLGSAAPNGQQRHFLRLAQAFFQLADDDGSPRQDNWDFSNPTLEAISGARSDASPIMVSSSARASLTRCNTSSYFLLRRDFGALQAIRFLR